MPRFVDCYKSGRLAVVAVMGLFLVAQPVVAGENSPPPAEEPQAANDPFEGISRVTSGFNAVVRGMIIDPLVDGYQAVTPDPIQEAVSNAVSNISEPVTAVSSLLQGDMDNAATATKWFIINTTVGLGGTSEPATRMGLEQREEDLGQALGASGIAPGPHLVLPIIGPSNFRDAAGDILTTLANPLPLAAKAASSGINYSNNQEDIKSLTAGALDPYVVERDSYEQNRRYEINNGVVPLTAFPEFAEDEEDKKKAP